MSHARKAFAVALAAASAWSACSIYDKSLLLPDLATDGSTLAEGGLAADAASTDASDDGGCQLFGPPPHPSANDGNKTVDVTMAMSFFRLVPGGSAAVNHPQAPVPMDLDHRCTCPAPASCISPSGTTICDADGGGDDATGNLWATFAALSPTGFNDDGLNTGLRLGYNGLLVRVRDYNGGQNDTQVTVSAFLSNGTAGVEDAGAQSPRYDGTDIWTVDPVSLLGGNQVDAGASCEGNDVICLPASYDTSAYVADGILVAHLSQVTIAAGDMSSKLRFALTDVVIRAPLVAAGTSYRMDEGLLAGRWDAVSFLTSLQGVPDPLDPSKGLCGASATYANVKQMACKGRDVMATQTQDNSGASCNALSITFAFAAVPAHLGGVYQAPGPPQLCGAGWTDTCP